MDTLLIVHDVNKECHLLDSFLYGKPLFILICQPAIQLVDVVEPGVKKIQELTVDRVRNLDLIYRSNESLCGFGQPHNVLKLHTQCIQLLLHVDN